MTLSERIYKVELKLKYIEKLIYVVLIIMGSHVGVEFLPLVSAFLG